MRHPCIKRHSSPLGNGWVLANGRYRPVRHTQPAVLTLLLALGPIEDNVTEYEDTQSADSLESDDSAYDETDFSDSD